ncbi:hypothetical protein HN419_02140 [Candidatus Woesearchaeota archaeon]|nr:hypothetical protein [Candidatus Woesearchaeota archaeon]MBT3537202.1 hypothetical protein [Candidatus Woesearchaeota archaeon]MBT4696652.1 hypothetical protein [Candidatus Woesearchaeota archaeon]MBT4716494.1 hypothetical protein [Candidatus Woesearchaeota archaeon]MBT7106488.1 hypothetical protein [Candidatus Woesearchaeota archaeon]
MNKGKVVLIGGSGVTDSPGFKDLEWKVQETDIPTIHPVTRQVVGTGRVSYQEREDGVIFIKRHGRSDSKLGTKGYGPSVTEYAANLVAARILGASVVIASSAVGSLQEEIPVGSLVVPDDYVDESLRNDNLFGLEIRTHTNRRPAFSKKVRRILINVGEDGFGKFDKVVKSATYVCIPGDSFGTAAEGIKRAQYADIVGMTACPEASMAQQLGLHYAIAAFPVDHDADANHEGGTLAVMKELSKHDRVPEYINEVLEAAKRIAVRAPRLDQLVGNVIPGDASAIENIYLRAIAEDIMQKYCS